MTIYDIAREAGVSASSVSRVINNRPGVNREMRQKIQRLLEQHHYLPGKITPEAEEKSRLVGVLVADIRAQHHIRGAYHIANELSRHDYYSMILNTGDSDEQRARGIQMLAQRRVEAVVLMGSTYQTPAVCEAIREHLPKTPIFMMNGFLDLPNVYGVLTDERSGIADCVQLLAAKGRRHIAFFVDKPTPSSQLKTEGFSLGMSRLGVPEKDLWVYRRVPASSEGGYQAARRLLRDHPDLDGLICSQDIIACGAMRALQARGKQVPQDVAVIGTDNSEYAEICTPALTSLDNMIFDSSVTIAHKLIDRLHGYSTNQRTLLLTNIVERAST